MNPCYTWNRECLDIPEDACAVQITQTSGSCPQVEEWFWWLTAILTTVIVVKRKSA